MCIAPILIPLIIKKNIKYTIGNNNDTAMTINNTIKSKHINCPVDDIVIDFKNKIVTSPAFMLPNRLIKIQKGIHKLVKSILLLI